ncbi:LRP1 [Mytilus coruscus]|uniref:LRP1 n=1 Tax=Mytilus coruscus TaxID=42192 RepID=A0A6J8AB91_MYTCO|nr:LRP1 [Mytilus coruscus]
MVLQYLNKNVKDLLTNKYLFTAPRNLWQGSREEFCISFHDDKDIQANYLVTLSLADESDVVLGNGTTNEEGRVCHHFTVPDLSGNHKLTLQTETRRILETGVFSTVTRVHVDSTEVEIHESALETFIQTDKPIYKPGETVKFRAMTINRDLKPWTGMVPLVTVKNPGDVRVMQWLNVENNKGLLSFEMPLSEDPPLGEWKITMLVEGKEHVQPFTVQEYVLPKYEVTITAPTFLLPTTETIQGTVCAKYTYGKPVKGKVELSVCFQDTSPYFYYYRSRDNSERPCANRIMDIDGCETYIVEGSELMLDSSNFSRYGNLMINATVTEQATGISLNGTVKGPEMTFEAIKLKFEDDTHGYFKDAFPYYARVIVTKPDGSPAPGELIEIKADNYAPEFHLKRNFTSDDNGLVKFAIKTLPKDVNRLSFNARAPKYFQPYGRYHHIIKMYEPSSYHNAQKWFSPSNSYIHIPSVENKVKCGSTLDLDVLYSTTLDTQYKFFVQVLSKSHMVHHTHVTHHFKSHDAVNFDSLPDDMLLDPYTPPPRPTWYYPIDPIPYYDDPELANKPEAENITISLDGDDGTAVVKPEPEPRENKTMGMFLFTYLSIMNNGMFLCLNMHSALELTGTRESNRNDECMENDQLYNVSEEHSLEQLEGLNQKEKRSVELDEEEKEEHWLIRKKRNTGYPTYVNQAPVSLCAGKQVTTNFVYSDSAVKFINLTAINWTVRKTKQEDAYIFSYYNKNAGFKIRDGIGDRFKNRVTWIPDTINLKFSDLTTNDTGIYDVSITILGTGKAESKDTNGSFQLTVNEKETVYIIFSNRHEIRRVDLDNFNYASLVSGLRNTVALDFYYAEGWIFWTDVMDEKIFRGKILSNSLTQIKPIIDVGLTTTEGLAVDWIGKNIYWVESDLDQIEVAKLDGSNRTTLIAGNMINPRAIVLDPRVGSLFWTDWDPKFPRIETCSMAGEKRRTIFNISGITGGGWPNGLAIDYDFKRLYWIDAKSDSIHTIDYNGADLRLILKQHKGMQHAFALTLFGNYVYWTDWGTNSLLRANKFNGSNVTTIQQNMRQPFDLQVYHPLRQPKMPNPCENNGNCSHLCLIGYDQVAKCLCPHLKKLNDDGKTCIGNAEY